ncbi:hypothetical protein PDIG_85680 [Penicillium digitatum PHI26]|uniref:Uncharacterized protein n=2 Tax=Penicillium digitatum TaxID=36651 RepID=K9FVB1_PEND2|nr:hypothetical protein PDIP_47370 [Penicillium digitatum Pd1]EKV05001.1 hypothetical protein PDIG_85680 [Penicillium digitatum PHI26]EKV13653.1 hypothetical protein PDIP_47370 [Penicillium digitatum Pd1]
MVSSTSVSDKKGFESTAPLLAKLSFNKIFSSAEGIRCQKKGLYILCLWRSCSD